MDTSDLFTRADLNELLEKHGEPCVSIYFSTHRMGRATQQDPIRLKNLLRKAEEQLAKTMRPTLAIDLLAEARAIVEDDQFWLHQSDGLALFVTEGKTRAWRLPVDFEETCVVADAFHLKPMLPLLTTDGLFYVLAISDNDVRLLQGSRQSVNEVVLQDVPSSMRELMADEGNSAPQSYHTAGRRTAVFHGHGGSDKSTEKDLRLKFFRQINSALVELLRDHPAPLVLAGAEEHFAPYTSVNSYYGLVKEGIAGSPDRTSEEELHGRAWEIVEPLFSASSKLAREKFAQLDGTGKTTTDTPTAMQAAMQGRAESAFVAVGVQTWGTWDDEAQRARVHEFQHDGDRDLLNEIAFKTLAAGGSVHAVPPEDVPGGNNVAVVLRY